MSVNPVAVRMEAGPFRAVRTGAAALRQNLTNPDGDTVPATAILAIGGGRCSVPGRISAGGNGLPHKVATMFCCLAAPAPMKCSIVPG